MLLKDSPGSLLNCSLVIVSTASPSLKGSEGGLYRKFVVVITPWTDEI